MHLGELNPVEQRVLGCLIEKRSTTPDQYPLSLNALRLACNQSTNRDPVSDYDEATVSHLLDLADQYGLIPTGGSDYHGPNMHPTPLGGRYVPEEAAERLRRTGEFSHRLPAIPFTLQEQG